jgi:hypothetical protein
MNIFMVIGILMQLANGVTVLHIQDRVPFKDMAECVTAMIKINQDERAVQVAACVQRWPDDRAKARRPKSHDEARVLQLSGFGAAGR